MIDIQIDEEQVKICQGLLARTPSKLIRASANAVNRAITAGKAVASKAARDEYVVKAAAVKSTLKTTKASSSYPTGVLTSTGSPILLGNFQTRQGSRALTARVKRGTSMQKVAWAFKRTTHSGFYGPLQRRYQKLSYPLKVLYGPSVPQMLGNHNVEAVIEARVRTVLAERLDHEVDAVLKGYAK